MSFLDHIRLYYYFNLIYFNLIYLLIHHFLKWCDLYFILTQMYLN